MALGWALLPRGPQRRWTQAGQGEQEPRGRWSQAGGREQEPQGRQTKAGRGERRCNMGLASSRETEVQQPGQRNVGELAPPLRPGSGGRR